MRLETVDAAETQPVGRVGAVAAGAGIAAGAAVGDDVAKTQPVAETEGGSGGGALTRRVSPSHARPRRSPRSHRPWLIAALALAVVVALTGVLIAATNDPFRPKAAARDAAREAAREAAQETVQNTLPPDTAETFADAWSGLASAIASAQASDDISDKAAEELTKKANELLDAYREGDAEKLGESLQHLEEELAKAVEEEEIAPFAADAVYAAIVDLGVAMQSEGALAVVPTSAPTGPTGDEQGNEDKHGGSPPHGEANGHEDD